MANPREMNSKWIWVPSWSEMDNAHPRIVYFRKTFTLGGALKKASVKVSADSRYRLYVNGVSVGFGPCKGDRFVWYYDEIDITPHLKEGENVLSAVVLRYPLDNSQGNQSVWRTDTPGLYVEGSVETEGGEIISLDTDETWKCSISRDIEIIPEGGLNFLWIMEKATGNAKTSGWKALSYNDESWENAKPYVKFKMYKSISPGSITKRPIPELYETEKKFEGTICLRDTKIGKDEWDGWLLNGKSIIIPPNSHEVVEINAGELTTGFLQLNLAYGAGSNIDILTSEAYAYPPKDVSAFQSAPIKGDRMDYVGGRLDGFYDYYTVDGYGTKDSPEYYEPFWFRTFRFISLDIITKDEPLILISFDYRETGYPLEVKTEVDTSDNEMKYIWDISLRTLRRCMHETYEDCPFYEQLQYAMDTRSQILFTYAVSADDRLARKCIDDFHRSLRPDGLTNCSYPSFGPNVIPGFSLFYILMIYDHMMYFGDKGFIRKFIPTMDAILNFFDSNITEEGIVGKVGGPLGEKFWSFIDWTAQWGATLGHPTAGLQGPITAESLLYAYVLKASADIAEYVGRGYLADEYRTRAKSVIDAVNKYCVGQNGYYQDGPGVDEYSQHAQVWAVLAEAISGSEAKALMEKTLDDAALTQCSVAMAYYLFRAVEKAGLYERTQKLWQPWRDMLKNNLTTCVESPGESARSDCHAWGSLALFEIPAVVLGVRPAKAGYAAVEVSPTAGYLDWAKGELITPRGIIEVEWEKAGGEIKAKVKAPDGVQVIKR